MDDSKRGEVNKFPSFIKLCNSRKWTKLKRPIRVRSMFCDIRLVARVKGEIYVRDYDMELYAVEADD